MIECNSPLHLAVAFLSLYCEEKKAYYREGKANTEKSSLNPSILNSFFVWGEPFLFLSHGGEGSPFHTQKRDVTPIERHKSVP